MDNKLRGADSELNCPRDRGIRPVSRIPVNKNIPEVGVTKMMLSNRSAVLIGSSIANSLTFTFNL